MMGHICMYESVAFCSKVCILDLALSLDSLANNVIRCTDVKCFNLI